MNAPEMTFRHEVLPVVKMAGAHTGKASGKGMEDSKASSNEAFLQVFKAPPLAPFPYSFPKTSLKDTFNLLITSSSRPRVMDCRQFSSRYSVEPGSPVFLENWA